MHPLSSPVREHRFLGRVEMGIGMVFIIIAAALNPLDAFVGLVVVTPVLSGLLYLVAFRRVAQQAADHASPAPTMEREDPSAFRRRVTGPLARALGERARHRPAPRAPHPRDRVLRRRQQ